MSFWGVRGSLAAPILPDQVQAKINAAVQMIQAKDLESLDARQKFLAELPAHIYGTAGGNTSCVQVETENGESVIFDAGTGIRVMGANARPPQDGRYSLFLSHLHWDHIQGFPFFGPLYNPRTSIQVYSPVERAGDFFSEQMRSPFYPVDFSVVKSRVSFSAISPGEDVRIGDVLVCCCKMSHPGTSYSYSVAESGKKFVYATDVELFDSDFKMGSDAEKVFRNADVAVLDSQYTPQEAVDKTKWGHSAFCYAVDFAAEMNVKKIYLFHHEPSYDDKKINSILQSARWYANFISAKKIEVELAIEGRSFSL